MKNPFNSPKKAIVAAGLAAAVTLGGGIGAYAYFTTTGGGQGSASVGTDTPVTINASTVGTLFPGTSVPVSFSIVNSSPGHELVNTISLSSVTSDKANCDSATNPSWFSMTAVSENQDVPSGTTAATNGGTFTFNNVATSQDVCKSASLVLHFTSN